MVKGRRKELPDQLSDLPDSILIHILSMLEEWRNKEVVKTSVLSTTWRSLWKFVPVSLHFEPTRFHYDAIRDFVTSTHTEINYWRSCKKIKKFSVLLSICDERFVKDVDLWASFALIDAKVEEFVLEFSYDEGYDVCEYKFPKYAYKNTSLRYLVLGNCILNPKDNVNWTSLVSLSLRDLKLIEGVIEKALSG
ncbi:hypothetical protein CQW23_00663 [Capsicum baccatum]|uniref:Uncharacterized protein n=1 Tax=Capsicum baccatum TaxID=33114 RepID=A0A2G2XLE4_CAPBA|nr:hypothetical protein CQW23_00663 [Capsicum baccatum]